MSIARKLLIALFLRLRAILVRIEGESEISDASSILLLTLFQIAVIFLLISTFKAMGGSFPEFSGDTIGKLIALGLTLIVAFLNWRLVHATDLNASQFKCMNESVYKFAGLFIVFVMVAIFVLAVAGLIT